MNVPFGRRVVMAALGRQPRRRRKWRLTPRIARLAWFADGAAVDAAEEG